MKRVLGLLCLFTLFGGTASAATLYMDPAFSTLSRGDSQIIAIRLDTDESQAECVNTLEGVLTFSGPITPVDISLGNSIFSIWVEPPTISDNRREVTFAGGIPNGYCGRIDGDPRLTNTIFEVIVRTDAVEPLDQKSVEASVVFTDQTNAYLNDGFGTRAPLDLLPKTITVLPELSTEIKDPWREEVDADTIDPQEFSVQLVQQPLLFNGRYYITFNTTDKQTGIDRYEVMEEPISQFGSFVWGRATAPWIEARSPYVLQEQNLNTVIRVRAIDKAGNQYVATYIPDKDLRTVPLTQILLLSLLTISILVLMFGIRSFLQKKRRLKYELELAELAANSEETFTSADTNSTELTKNTYDQRN